MNSLLNSIGDESDPVVRANRRLVRKIILYGYTGVQKYLKDKQHRSVSHSKVMRLFQQWIKSGDFTEYVASQIHYLMKQRETEFGRPFVEWTTDDKLWAFNYLGYYFDALREKHELKPGRPKNHLKPKSGKEKTSDGVKAALKDFSKAELHELDEAFFRFEKYYKLGMFSLQQANYWIQDGHSEREAQEKFGTIDAAMQEALRGDWINQDQFEAGEVDEIIMKIKSVGIYEDFLDQLHIDLSCKDAMKMRILRARKKQNKHS